MGIPEFIEDTIKPAIEIAVQSYIETNGDKHTEAVLDALTKFIPGTWDDALVAAKKPEILTHVKKILLSEAEKISDKV